ncbi:hypothetical protein B0H34DRAFT_810535 [Crassisporium funariophilum]|nr:hypothetical protein B0H34DRAFT_810535 [Crassisporium funariophilum]
MASSPLTSPPSSPAAPAPTTPSPEVESEIIESSFTSSTSNAQSENPEAPSTPPNKLTNVQAYTNTPLSRTENSTKLTLTENQAMERYTRLAQDIQPHLVGPMPLDIFFKEFLPGTQLPMPSSVHAFDKVPHPEKWVKKGKKFDEKVMNEPLVEALNGSENQPRCPGIKFFNTGDHSESQWGSKMDICGYLDGEGTNTASPGFLQTFVEIKLIDFACDDPQQDPKNPEEKPEFLFSHIPNLKLRERAQTGLGQQVSYATEVCARQHRNFLFSIFITPTIARFLRWDRSGVVVSASFNYRTEPLTLCNFLWKLGNMTHEQRGADISVTKASQDEEKIFAEAIRTHIKAQLGNEYKEIEHKFKGHYEPGIVIKIPVRKCMSVKPVSADVELEGDNAVAVGDLVRTADTERQVGKQTGATGGEKPAQKAEIKEIVTFNEAAYVTEFLVSRPVMSPLSLASRGTRAYWAVHAKNKTVHFLKDAWRTAVEDLEVEGRILEKIAAAQVRNTPTVLCWSDVGPQGNPAYSTVTSRYKGNTDWNKHWQSEERLKKIRLTNRVHYRHVTKEAGYTLEQMAGTLELLRGARDAFQALCDAHSRCNRLHRDVSASNIILYTDAERPYPERKAILVDWELSCEDIVGPARDHWRSVSLIILVCTLLISSQGTWAFMSINTLQGGRPHHICDDIESLIYVVFYCAIHFLPWIKSYDAHRHRNLVDRFFNDYDEEDVFAATAKTANLYNSRFFNSVTFDKVSAWLSETLPHMMRYQAAEPAENVIKAYTPLFERDDSYWMSLHKMNKERHKLPYRGPDIELHHGTTSVSALQKSSKISAPLNAKKREVSSVDDPDEGSAGKRRRNAELPVAGASELRRSSRIKHLPPK